jgi:DNA primase
MNYTTTAFFCHSCHARGNAITLAATLLGVSPIQATRMLKQRYSPAGIHPDARNMEEEIRALIAARDQNQKRGNKRLDESVLDAYRVDWQVQLYQDAKYADPWARYLYDRGFRVSHLVSWEFGYSKRLNRVTLPVRDEEGYLVGIKARALDDQKPKYLNLHDKGNGVEPYLKNEVVFALNRVLDDDGFLSGTPLILVEGEYNAIAMHEFHGFRNSVAINGSYFGERQIKLIKRWCDHAILFFDTDKAGADATIAVGEALKPFIEVSICPDHHGDPMVMHPYSVRSCIAEARSMRELQLV